jgi:hypothetical protein
MYRVGAPFHVYADPDPSYHYNADPRIHLFTLMRIRIPLLTLMRLKNLLFIEVMRICDHRYTEPPGLHYEPQRLHCERPRPSTAPF